LAATAGTRLPIAPRRGFILVTEPLHGAREEPPIRHKVYAADYLDSVASDDAGLATSAVVEGTRAGTVLIGSSRERVGLDSSYPLPVLRRIAAQAVALFPFLAKVQLLRAYRGFRPFTPDHLPVIGPDPRVGGLWHAGGHEGAGIGLAPGTGALIAAQVAGTEPDLDPAPFAPARFANA
jgi:D-hydroxyproline dehydrogenase subunit beta